VVAGETVDDGAMEIALVLYPSFTSLDLIGGYQVLTQWPDSEVQLVAASDAPVADDQGLVRLAPQATFADVRSPDVVLIPGSSEPFGPLVDEPLLTWLRDVEPTATWMTSVCTGAGVLAAAGLLDGRRAATHWAFRDVVASAGVDVVPERYVFDGKFVTGGGVTAGIDMTLALTAHQFGDETAKVIQLALEYDPAPPFAGGTLETSEPAIVDRALQALADAASADVSAAR
jgi:transcriptional regulator GlxA family with amidase domain